MVPDAAFLGSDQQPWGTAPAAGPVGQLGCSDAPHPWGVVYCFPSLSSLSVVCSLGVLCCVYRVLGHLAPVHLVLARCVVLRVRCPGPLGSCSPVFSLGALCCVCSVLGPLAPLHRCACSVRCVACALSWATCLLFISVLARCVVLRWRCPGPIGSFSPLCSLGASCWVCGVLGHLAPVHRCAAFVRSIACVVSWATWLLFTGCPPGAVRCVCGVLSLLAPVHRCARLAGCVACSVSWTTCLLFTGVLARCVALRVRCSPPLDSC